MTLYDRRCMVLTGVVLACTSMCAVAQKTAAPSVPAAPTRKTAVLVELFTSEGCSSCPPADELLRKAVGKKTAEGQLIVGISEHVSYWNGLGWKDPYSSEQYTNRQNDYGSRFGLDSVYTPQMVVNGREQFSGADGQALVKAFAAESQRKQIELHITGMQATEKNITFSYSASELPANSSLQLVAVLTDDVDRSNVLHGENAGRELMHASVARALSPLGALRETEQQSVTLPLPPSFTAGTGHHLVLFAQQKSAGAVMGIDTRPF